MVSFHDNRDGGDLKELKAEAQGELELALAVEGGAVGIGDGAEAGSAVGSAQESEAGIAARRTGSVDDVAGGVDVGDVLVVEDVEDFTDDFEVVTLAYLRVFGEAGVNVVDAWVAEGVASHCGDAVVPPEPLMLAPRPLTFVDGQMPRRNCV